MSEAAFENLEQTFGPGYHDKLTSLDKPLTDEEKRAVLEREDHGVTDPVKQTEYETRDEFKKKQNNFYVHFSAPEPGVMVNNTYKARRAFQRFELLYPEMASRMIGRYGQNSPFSEQEWQDLFDAYQKMTKLVDKKDEGVVAEIRQGDSEDQLTRYLCG